MKKLLSIFSLFIFISGCSSKTESFTVVCETDKFFDESLTFDFETNLVTINRTLNKYGYESKKLYESLYADRRGEEDFEERMSIFNESEMTKQIRSLDDGLIIYGVGLEPREDFDMQSTFNRASLKIKTVTKYGDVFNDLIEEDNNLERENVSYAECMKPAV
jgi:hypothetical protein